MADQYAKKLIDQSIGGLNGDYPSQETVCSLIKDTEDILFISPCSLDWNWMYGRVMQPTFCKSLYPGHRVIVAGHSPLGRR